MLNIKIGEKVSIAFNSMPDDERKRLTLAAKERKSKVEQSNHQTDPETGTVTGHCLTDSGMRYLVNVDSKKMPKGRNRLIEESKLSVIGG